jgi:adenosylcobyric acid synthase
LQAHQQGIPLLGICGGYQMLGEAIVDEVESGLGALPGLGLLDRDAVPDAKPPLRSRRQWQARCRTGWRERLPCGCAVTKFIWGNDLNGRCRPVMQHKSGEQTADGAMTDDGLVSALTCTACSTAMISRALVNGLRQRKGLEALDTTLHYAQYKAQQFDILAAAMRQHIDIEKIYHIMQQHQEPSC